MFALFSFAHGLLMRVFHFSGQRTCLNVGGKLAFKCWPKCLTIDRTKKLYNIPFYGPFYFAISLSLFSLFHFSFTNEWELSFTLCFHNRDIINSPIHSMSFTLDNSVPFMNVPPASSRPPTICTNPTTLNCNFFQLFHFTDFVL